MTVIKTKPFQDQRAGTSGLRKTVSVFTQPHYLENYVQSLFDCVPQLAGATLILGGDGRYHNDVAIQTVLRMAEANKVARVVVGQNGLLSTPAVSHLIRKLGAAGGIILSASHNPAGPDGDFGIKLNIANGGSAPESVTASIFTRTQNIDRYLLSDIEPTPLGDIADYQRGAMQVSVIDSVNDYADHMRTLFNFDAISALFAENMSLCFDAMHAVTGPYAMQIFSSLGAPKASIMNAVPLPDFGGGHPDPNPVHARALFATMFDNHGPDFGAASDGDGDRNIILGRNIYVSPSDSLAIIAANAHLAPGYSKGLSGVARSMPTSRAVDVVAKALGIAHYETPTGWKFFGNLLDSGDITICGEESAGTSSDHVREKDGLWAVLMWLNIIAVRGQSVPEIVHDHWAKYGRHYYTRHDYEAVDSYKAHVVMRAIEDQLPQLLGQSYNGYTVSEADSFSYHDPIDGSTSHNQGLRILFENGSRIVFRLSGTGTVGATLRLYLEKYAQPDEALHQELQSAIEPLLAAALEISNLPALTGRSAPTVIS